MGVVGDWGMTAGSTGFTWGDGNVWDEVEVTGQRAEWHSAVPSEMFDSFTECEFCPLKNTDIANTRGNDSHLVPRRVSSDQANGPSEV